jgi:hypothetical protein
LWSDPARFFDSHNAFLTRLKSSPQLMIPKTIPLALHSFSSCLFCHGYTILYCCVSLSMSIGRLWFFISYFFSPHSRYIVGQVVYSDVLNASVCSGGCIVVGRNEKRTQGTTQLLNTISTYYASKTHNYQPNYRLKGFCCCGCCTKQHKDVIMKSKRHLPLNTVVQCTSQPTTISAFHPYIKDTCSHNLEEFLLNHQI